MLDVDTRIKNRKTGEEFVIVLNVELTESYEIMDKNGKVYLVGKHNLYRQYEVVKEGKKRREESRKLLKHIHNKYFPDTEITKRHLDVFMHLDNQNWSTVEVIQSYVEYFEEVIQWK